MLIKKLTYTTLFCMATLSVTAQDSLLFRDYQFVKQANPWLTGQNAAALTRFAEDNIAQAELALSSEKGGFTNYYGSPEVLKVDAGIESFYRFSPRTVFFGRINYQNFSGHDMAGSAFINPERRPFDIVEDSLNNTGTKHLDTYNLCAGFGTKVTEGLSLGAKVDYTAANYAKYKDLRHQNKLMDLHVTAGLAYDVSENLTLGANYLYHRNTESIRFGTYGTSDKVYKSLVSYANFTGHVEQFGTEGYTDKSREMPLVTNYNGLGIQLSTLRSLATSGTQEPSTLNSQLFTHHLSLFASYDYSHGKGYYGRKSPYTITYTDHCSDHHHFYARLTHFLSETSRHQLGFEIDDEQLQNEANTFREMLNESKATYYEYYSPTKTADRRWQLFNLDYTLYLGIREAMPTWTIQIGRHRMKRRQTAYVFPYYRRQNIHSTETSLSVCRNFIATKGIWSLTLNGTFLQGGGEPFEDLTFQTPSDKQAALPSMDAYLWREYQWLTAKQFSIGGQVKYAFIFPGTKIKTYALLALSHRKANETYTYSNGQNRTQATLAIGCEF